MLGGSEAIPPFSATERSMMRMFRFLEVEPYSYSISRPAESWGGQIRPLQRWLMGTARWQICPPCDAAIAHLCPPLRRVRNKVGRQTVWIILQRFRGLAWDNRQEEM